MDLKHLKTFLELSRIKNFTKTAEILNYSQSNVTAQIRQLEEELGVKLFERLGKTVELTAEGGELLPYAVKMLSLSDEAETLFHGGERKKKIVIGASESLSIFVLPEILGKYKTLYPDTEVYMRIVEDENFVTLLAENVIDFAAALENCFTSPSIIKIRNEKLMLSLYCAPSNPLASKKKVTIKDLAGVPLVTTCPGCSYRDYLDKEFAKNQMTPEIVLETSSVPALKEAAINGIGTAFLPDITAKHELENGSLARLNYHADVPVYMQFFYHKDKWISPALKNFIDII